MTTSTNFIELYDWWFNPENKKYWFNSTEENDKLITEKFGYLVNIQIDICNKKLDFKESIAYILVHDQIIRHYLRVNMVLHYLEKLYKYTHYNIIKEFIKNFYENNKNNLHGYYFTFVLLPLRHTNEYKNIKYVLDETWNKIENTNNNELIKIYTNYLKATYERANYKFVNTITEPFLKINMHKNIDYYIAKYEKVLDKKSFYEYSDNYINYKYSVCNLVKVCQQIPVKSKLVVSISGGVDSMVLSWILKKLNYDIVLVHINYNNREDSDLEQELVVDWGNYLDVKVFYRKLEEINRPKCMKYNLRNTYEDYTRNQRYNAYIETSKIMGWKNDYQIVLGHNNDDCIENIFSNITNKTKYENLYGMDFITKINFDNNILTFCRPLLTISKDGIYKFAFQNNILFLWDSTPKWSNRGKIRDIVRPSLDSYSNLIIPGLNELVKILSESVECVDHLVNAWYNKIITNDIYDKIESNKYIIVEIKELINNKIFWNKFLTKNCIKFSTKSLDNFIETLIKVKNNFIKLEINKIIKVQINKSKQIIFIKNKKNKLVIFL
jgi:tRNA(Ile)-lysidine synthetase-like protein